MAQLSKQEKLKHCVGCSNNFYNGNNNYGIKECWNLKDAELVSRKEVHINQRPPWTQKPEKFLNCYCRRGYAYFDAKITC